MVDIDKRFGGVETKANWAPLERRLAPELCAEFMWMCRVEEIEHYKHVVSRRYLFLDADGRCLVRAAEGWREASFEREWRRITGRMERSGGDGGEYEGSGREASRGVAAGGEHSGEAPRQG